MGLIEFVDVPVVEDVIVPVSVEALVIEGVPVLVDVIVPVSELCEVILCVDVPVM